MVDHKGREAREVELGLLKGLNIREKEMAEVTDVAAEVILTNVKLLLRAIAALVVCVIHTDVIVMRLNDNKVILLLHVVVRMTDEVDANRHLRLLLCLSGIDAAESILASPPANFRHVSAKNFRFMTVRVYRVVPKLSTPKGCLTGAYLTLDHFKLLTHNRGTHCLKKDLLGRVMKVEPTAMVGRIAMQATEGLLTLTSDTRKRELLLTIGVRTLALHLYRDFKAATRTQIYCMPLMPHPLLYTLQS